MNILGVFDDFESWRRFLITKMRNPYFRPAFNSCSEQVRSRHVDA